MNLILSRKGMDSGSGGTFSPYDPKPGDIYGTRFQKETINTPIPFVTRMFLSNKITFQACLEQH